MDSEKTIKSKAILCFDSFEEAKIAMNGTNYLVALEEVWERVFRPNFKHGYSNEILDNKDAYPVIEELSKIFNEILEDRSVDLWS